jgi:multidrug transporter EmrE-like cation transporter
LIIFTLRIAAMSEAMRELPAQFAYAVFAGQVGAVFECEMRHVEFLQTSNIKRAAA